MFGKPWRQILNVFAVAGQPVDCRIMPRIGKLLIKGQKRACKPLGVLRDRLGKVAALRGHRPDNGNRTGCSIQVAGNTGTFIKSRNTRGQIGWKPFLSRHFFQTSGNFTQSFSPSGGRVSHNSDVVAHIAVIFRQSDTGIDRSFTGRYRHI